jgi:hypothetical protein
VARWWVVLGCLGDKTTTISSGGCDKATQNRRSTDMEGVKLALETSRGDG